MANKKVVEKFINAQQSIQFYGKVRKAFKDVLKNFSNDEFNTATQNLILVVLHEGALGQVMHFSPITKKFQIMQLTIPKSIPIKIMRYVIAHEFGRIMQRRNWKKGDGLKLEDDADSWAKKWGFPFYPSFRRWLNTDRLIKGNYRDQK